MLSFRLLGQATVYNAERPLTKFRSQKEAALLIYLAHTGQTVPREFMAEFLWDERSSQQARSNLRTLLSRLRKWAGDALVTTRTTVALAPESRQDVDSVRLLEALAQVEQVTTPEAAAQLEQALALYHGEFLAGFSAPDAPRFEQWTLTVREQIHRQVVAAYRKLGEYFLSTGDLERGIALARRWLQVDELDEGAHLLLTQFLIEADRAGEAVAHYDTTRELLDTELGVAPPMAMTALVQRARSSQPGAFRPPAQSRHNLPPVHDQFVGRVAEQEAIHRRLDQPWCRLLTLAGPGGVGKTRLAITIARSRLDRYEDGVWFVELESVAPDDPDIGEAIAVEIATALSLRLAGSAKPVDQLFNYLRQKHALLILDNFESVLPEGIQFVLELIQACENVQLLVTSRESLRVRAEWLIDLSGLRHPDGEQDDRPSDAMEMLQARLAQQWQGAAEEDEAAMRRLCRLVEGLPLAIELAAGLTASNPLHEIVARLQADFDALETTLRDAPERHRSLRAVFEMSWQALSPALQSRLARLSLFRGGFTPLAAQEVAQVTATELQALNAKSLVVHDPATDRYRIHPVIRAYAAEKLPEEDPAIRRHAEHYLTLLAQYRDALEDERAQPTTALLELEIDNIRAGWQTGLAYRLVHLLQEGLPSLTVYYQLRGLSLEGANVMHATRQAALMWGQDGVALATQAGLAEARFQLRLGRYGPAIATLESTLALAQGEGDRRAEGMVLVWWGEALWRAGELVEAHQKLCRALDMGRALEDDEIIAWSHHQLGVVRDIQGRHWAALEHLQQAQAIWESRQDTRTLCNTLNSIGLVRCHQGDWGTAQETFERALALCTQLDDRHLQTLLLNNLSLIAIEQGAYRNALDTLRQGLTLAAATGNLAAQGEILLSMGRTHLLLGETEAALETLENALHIARSLGNRPLTAGVLCYLARTRQARRETSRAKSLYNQALALTEVHNLQAAQCEVLLGLAELLQEQGDVHQARSYAAQGLALAQELQAPRLMTIAAETGRVVGLSVQ